MRLMMIPPQKEYVYAVRYEADPGYIKLGRTTDPQKRMAQLQVAGRSAAKMLWCAECDNNMWYEYQLHQTFKHKLVRGEWFKDVTIGMLDRAKDIIDGEYQVMQFGEDLATQIGSERRRQKLSQVKLAELAGVRQATISGIENGQARHLPTLVKVISALGKRLRMVD